MRMTAFPPTPALDLSLERVPLFPLPRAVLLPHTLLPLHVFEPRYRALIADLIASDGVVGVPMLGPGWEDDYDGRPALVPVMGVGRVLRYKTRNDGRFDVLIGGMVRARIVDELDTATPYRVVRAEALPEPEGPDLPGLERPLREIRARLVRMAHQRPDARVELLALSEDQRCPKEMLDVLAGMALRTPSERQAYLETDRISRRAEIVLSLMIEHTSRASDAMPEA